MTRHVRSVLANKLLFPVIGTALGLLVPAPVPALAAGAGVTSISTPAAASTTTSTTTPTTTPTAAPTATPTATNSASNRRGVEAGRPSIADHLVCLDVPGARRTHFLIGSAHFGLRTPVTLGPRLQQAIAASHIVTFETVLSGTRIEAEAIRQASVPLGKRQPGLSPTLAARLDEDLGRLLGDAGRRWRESSPLQIYVALTTLILRNGGVDIARLTPSLDERIRHAALDADKALAMLEKPADQIRIFNEASIEVWEKVFTGMLDTIACQSCSVDAVGLVDSLSSRLLAGDWAGVHRLAAEAVDGELVARTSAVRDPVLASRILERVRAAGDQAELFVLGAAHVADPDGLLARLREQGIGIRDGCDVAEGGVAAEPFRPTDQAPSRTRPD